MLCLIGIPHALRANGHHSLVSMKVLAYEGDTITDSFSISVKVKFLDTVKQLSPLMIHLPTGWSMMDTASMDTTYLFTNQSGPYPAGYTVFHKPAGTKIVVTIGGAGIGGLPRWPIPRLPFLMTQNIQM